MFDGFFVLVAVFLLVGGAVNLGRGDLEAVSVVAVVLVLVILLGVPLWRAIRVAVSPRGVSLRPDSVIGFFRRWQWLAWSDIKGFEREEPAARAMAVRIVATRTSAEPAVVCQVGSHELDSAARFGDAVKRVLARLEDERRVRLRDHRSTEDEMHR